MAEDTDKGLRYNEGKNRMGLLSPNLVREISKVLTFGANKYSADNYALGMRWSKVIDSLERHWQEFKAGNDYDEESGELHLAHLGCNLQFLIDYYTIYPEGDDRRSNRLKPIKYALDIDEVCADFCGAWYKRHGGVERPDSWGFDKLIYERLTACKEDKEFWLGLEPIFDATELPAEPTCYVTHRICESAITEEWLYNNGFPTAPVITVNERHKKIDVLKEHKVEIFLDDNYDTFKQVQQSGILSYLFDRKHNARYRVGHWRIKNIKDLPVFRYQLQ